MFRPGPWRTPSRPGWPKCPAPGREACISCGSRAAGTGSGSCGRGFGPDSPCRSHAVRAGIFRAHPNRLPTAPLATRGIREPAMRRERFRAANGPRRQVLDADLGQQTRPSAVDVPRQVKRDRQFEAVSRRQPIREGGHRMGVARATTDPATRRDPLGLCDSP